jgi:hypothetical protein
METIVPAAAFTLALGSLTLLTAWWMRRRQPGPSARGDLDALDTVADWSPQAVRVMTLPQRRAYDLIRRALPHRLVLAQVPIARFISVAPGKPYREWLARVGRQNVDIVVCDSRSRVIAAVELRSPMASARSIERYGRMARVLEAAGISVHVWAEEALPSAVDVRRLLSTRATGQLDDADSAAMPLPEIQELLADGDALDVAGMLEPVPSTFFTQLDAPNLNRAVRAAA